MLELCKIQCLKLNLGPAIELTKISISESYFGPSYGAHQDFNIFWAKLMVMELTDISIFETYYILGPVMELTKISISKTYFGPISETIFVLGPAMELTKNLISGDIFDLIKDLFKIFNI